jgi:hypothetical protein
MRSQAAGEPLQPERDITQRVVLGAVDAAATEENSRVESSMISWPVNRSLCLRNSGEPASIGSNPVRRPNLMVVLRFAWC